MTKALKEAGIKNIHVEGLPNCDWVLIDSGDVIVHVFRPEVREFYNLERLWTQSPAAAKAVLAGRSRCESADAHVLWTARHQVRRKTPLMRLIVIAVGRLKQGPERELAERYRERFDDIGRKLGFRGLDIHEIAESRARDAATRMAEEAARDFGALIPEKYVLDRAGRARQEHRQRRLCPAFGPLPRRWRRQDIIFVIGGADGLSPELRRKAKLTIAFGAATWPHQMVRVMLLEQIYRAATILAGHPYHRA